MGREKRVEAARRWQNSRVILEDPASTYIDEGVAIGTGTTIGPNTQLRGGTRIGKDCGIDGSAYLLDAELGDRLHLRFSVAICEFADG